MRESGFISLPPVEPGGDVSVERALARRRSVRRFSPDPLSLGDLTRLLWAAQGVTRPVQDPPRGFAWRWGGGYRTAPSAGALYPLELYVVAGRVGGLDPGLFHYRPVQHALERTKGGDLRPTLWTTALEQDAVREAPASLVVAGVVERTAVKYGERAERYVLLEVGAVAQNVHFECEALGLGTVVVGAFHDEELKEALGLPGAERIFAVLPVGRPAG